MKPIVYARRAGLTALALLLPLSACAGQGQGQAQEVDHTVVVETAAAGIGTLNAESTYIGTISAEGTANVVPLVSGNVEEVLVSVGQTVQAGQLLCRFDDTTARLNLENARTAYQNALVGVESAQAQSQAAQAGVQQAQAGAQTAQATLEQAQAGLQSAQAQAQAAQAGLQSAQENYNSAVANYGGEDLPILTEQVRLAQENYDNTKALFDIGAASQLEVDQAGQSLRSAQGGLEGAKSALSAARAGVQSAQAAVQQAQAGVQSAQAAVEQAGAAIQQSGAGMSSAQAGVTQSSAGIGSARNNVEAAKVGVESAEYQLTLYNLESPITGVVEAVNLTQNNFAASGSLAFVISNANNKTVTFYVTGDVRDSLVSGQPVSVSAKGSTYSGQVTEIGGVVDDRTGLFQVKAIIENAQDLADGLKVELLTASRTAANTILIPSDALYFDNGDAYVYVMEDQTAVRRPVTVGLYTSEQIAVSDGLSEGDQVITTWSATLRDGAPVRLAEQGGEA